MAISLTRIREVAFTEGAGAVAERGIRRAQRLFFARDEYVVFAATPIEINVAPPHTEAKVEWSLVDSPDAAPKSLPRDRLAAGAIACCAWSEDNTLAHVSWAVSGSSVGIDQLERYADLTQCVYIGNCWTAPEARGLGLYPTALWHLMEFLSRKGHRRFVLTIEGSNTASMRGVAKASFRRVGDGALVKVLGWSWWKGTAIG